MANDNEWPGPVQVKVCLECGTEYTFDRTPPPDDLTCEKCGNEVFRDFYDSSRKDDVQEDFDESTGREVASDTGGTDVSDTDLLDLNNP